MLAKKTSKNQVTLPKRIADQLPEVDYFEVSLVDGSVVLKPAIVSAPGARLSAIRAKMRALGLTEHSVTEAVRWARSRRR
jgi:hypothetical protein